MRSKAVGVLAFGWVLAEVLVGADCNQAGNLIPNCGFDSDLAGWVVGAADSSTHVPDDGGFALGCAELDRNDSLNALQLISSCVAVDPDTAYSLGAAYRLTSGPILNPCFLDVLEYDDLSCGNFLGSTPYLYHPESFWSERFDTHTTGSTTGSVAIEVICSSGKNDFVVRFDDFLFGEDLFSAVVFIDGFESGFFNIWSSTSP